MRHALSVNKTKIMLLCVVAATAYGVLHDQIAVRLSAEYYTVAHPPVFPVTSPALMALCWCVVVMSGIGSVYGVFIAHVSHSGPAPAVPFERLCAPVARLLAVMALAALATGLCGYLLSLRGVVAVSDVFADGIAPQRRPRFIAVCFAHGASYLVGLTGGAWIAYGVWRERGCPAVLSLYPRSRGEVVRTAIVAAVAACVLWICLRAH
jgi:hypothetical protein